MFVKILNPFKTFISNVQARSRAVRILNNPRHALTAKEVYISYLYAVNKNRSIEDISNYVSAITRQDDVLNNITLVKTSDGCEVYNDGEVVNTIVVLERGVNYRKKILDFTDSIAELDLLFHKWNPVVK